MIVVIDPFDMAASLRVVAKVRKLGEKIDAIMFGGEPLHGRGLSKIYMVRSDCYPKFVTVKYADVVCRLLKIVKEGTVVFPSTRFCRSLAPRVAAKMGCGLTADCVEISKDVQIAPAFSGSALATIVSKGGKFRMVTMIANEPLDEVSEDKAEVVETVASLEIPWITESSDRDVYGVNSEADVILSAGFGIGSSRTFDKMQRLAERMGASLGATLAAVNAGFAPKEMLIGQTGATVSPRIYMAFGISGHIQHTVGIAQSSTIVSVNTDSESAMSLRADYAIVADAADTVEKMLRNYE